MKPALVDWMSSGQKLAGKLLLTPFHKYRNEQRMWKTTINGISCLTSLKRKRRNNV